VFDRWFAVEYLITSEVIIVGGIGNQPASSAGLAAVPSLVKSANPHGEGLKQLFDDISIGVIEIAVKISFYEGRQIPYPIDEKLRPIQPRSSIPTEMDKLTQRDP
jgi:hypothetical protein